MQDLSISTYDIEFVASVTLLHHVYHDHRIGLCEVPWDGIVTVLDHILPSYNITEGTFPPTNPPSSTGRLVLERTVWSKKQEQVIAKIPYANYIRLKEVGIVDVQAFGALSTLGGWNLTELRLENVSQVTDASLSSIASKCPNLRTLSLAWSMINLSDVGLIAIGSKCTQLRSLDLCMSIPNKRITNKAFESFTTNQLTHVNLSITESLGTRTQLVSYTYEGLAHFIQRCFVATDTALSTHTKGRSLALDGHNVTDDVLQSLFLSNENWRRWDCIGVCRTKITSAFFENPVWQNHQMEYLHTLCLGGNESITDGVLSNLAASRAVHSIHVLNLSGTSVTDTGCNVLLLKLSSLEVLDLSLTRHVTDSTLYDIAFNCPNLRELNINGTNGRVTNNGVALVLQRCFHFETLHALGTEGYVTLPICFELHPKTMKTVMLNRTNDGYDKVADLPFHVLWA